MRFRTTAFFAAACLTFSLATSPAEALTWHKFTAPKIKGVSTTGQWARLGKNVYKVKLCVKKIGKDRRWAFSTLETTGYPDGVFDGETVFSLYVKKYKAKKCETAVFRRTHTGKVQHSKVRSELYDPPTAKNPKGKWKRIY